MKNQLNLGLSFVLLFFLLTGCSPSKKFQSIFNGRTWQNWEGSKDFFRIENTAIVAGTLEKRIPTNQFLCTEKRYKDFELKLKVKFPSTVNNAGIQFRTERIPNHHEVIGYQADVGFDNKGPVWCGLYDESRRNKFMVEPPKELLKTVLKPDDWNDYRIYAKGPNIKFWLNGEQVLEYTEADPSIADSGIICVQIHGGKPAEAWYKDMEIREL